MQRSDFNYALPAALIAQRPLARRSASRLLCVGVGNEAMADRVFEDLPALLQPGDLLVLNDTRVIPARLHGHKTTGGAVEILIERLLAPPRALAQIRASKAPREGSEIELADGIGLVISGRDSAGFYIVETSDGGSIAAILDRYGHMPLPPYIARADEPADRERYQTVYARAAGAVAAPTAGLHFDEALLARLREKGVDSGYVTLHVGAGTFQPVRVEALSEHRMHREYLCVTSALCGQVERARARGGRVIGVGTTSVRALETAARGSVLAPFDGDTDLFITPGFEFRVVDALITNFHLPESTLLMLVCAFGGYARVMNAYRHAVADRYRFFSYGDAMFVSAH